MSSAGSKEEAAPIAKDLAALATHFKAGPPANCTAAQQAALRDLEAAVASCKHAFNLYAADRRYRRHKVDLRIVVTRYSDNEQSLGRGNDLGYGGMAVYVPLELHVGERVHIAFSLPYTRVAFGLHATVRNGSSFKYGVAFEPVTETQHAEIDRICAKLAAPE